MFILPRTENDRHTLLRAWTPKFKESSTEFLQRFKPGGFLVTMSAKDCVLLKSCASKLN